MKTAAVLSRSAIVALLAAAALLPTLAGPAVAQEKPTLTADDYGQWERLGPATLSPDGRWMAVLISRVNEESELRVHATDSDSVVVIPFANRPVFTSDNRWLAYSIGVSPDERERMQAANQPVRNKLGLLELNTGEQETIDAIQSFSFSEDGRFVALRRYRPEGKKSSGVDVLVRDMASGAPPTTLGNVAQMAWQEDGHLLAMTIDAEDRIGNGVSLYDAASGRVRTLDADEATYRHLGWREESADLAVLKTYTDEEHEDTAHVVMAWRDLDDGDGRRFVLDPREGVEVPASSRVTEYRSPTWSEDGRTIFVGMQERKPVEGDDEAEGDEEGDEEAEDEGEEAEGDEEEDGPRARRGAEEKEDPPGVEIWHAKDVDPVPQQRVRENTLRRVNHIARWHLDDGSFLQLGGDHADRASLVEGGGHMLARDETPYDVDAMFRQQFYDIYAVDAATGQRELVREHIFQDYGGSPGGRYILWFEGDHYWTHDLRSGETRNITEGLEGTFVNLDVTPTREQMPSYGTSGWMEDDEAVLINDQWDVWEVRPDGSGGQRLTNGAEDEVRHRVIRLDREADAHDPDEPLYYSMYGEWTKKAGFSRARRGRDPEPLIWEDASIGGFGGGLQKAEDADLYVIRRERFDDSPDYFVTRNDDLSDLRQVTNTNPFQSDYAWGRTELIDYENEWGRPLQGALVYPANYEAGRTYPMIVYHYELLSQGLHRYLPPNPTSYYDIQTWSQEGYFVLQPDIVYRDRRPGQSNVETLRPAVAAAVATGMIDPERVGLIGHSWGGYQTTFFVTQDNLFAGAVAGAPLTNLMSMYLSFYWNSGGTDARIFEISQGRMQVPWWDDWDSYYDNSPVHHIKNMNTPLLMMFGSEDGAVEFNQGVEFYNAARRLGKDMVLLVYDGENHGLRREPNQKDYRDRILQWFAHYLKGEPAPDWITKGLSYIEQKDGLQKRRGPIS